MHHRRLFGCLLLVVVFGGCSASGDGNPRALAVMTQWGPVEGIEDDGVFSYRGIPYAAPPVGALRWKPPIDPEVVSRRLGRALAVAFAPVGANPGNESWLYFNGAKILSDVPAEALEEARTTLQDEGLAPRAAIVRADGRALPFRGGSFDGVTHTDVLC